MQADTILEQLKQLVSGATVSMMVGLVLANTVGAEPDCRPVAGRAETQIVPPPTCASPVGICTSGRVFGSLHGTLKLTATSLIPSGAGGLPEVSFFTGQSVIQVKNGDVLIGIDTGAFDLQDGTVVTLLTWVGGTGQFAGASGHIRISANLDFSTGIVESRYKGEICTSS